ncbi:unnamed protein product [Discosporangium mesarthrocarpum]
MEDDEEEDEGVEEVGGLELPSDVLQAVRSEDQLRRKTAGISIAHGRGLEISPTAVPRKRVKQLKAGERPRSDNFQLVVLDKDGDIPGLEAKVSDKAKAFLSRRMGARKRVNHQQMVARGRLGPNPHF